MEIANLIAKEFPGRTLSGLGGIETGEDAAQFILLGSDTVQVCTGVMKFGYECVRPMCDQLLAFMAKHKFETLADFKGKSLPYFTTHADLVQRQAARKAAQKAGLAARRRSWPPTANGAATPSCNSPTPSRRADHDSLFPLHRRPMDPRRARAHARSTIPRPAR